MARKPNGKTSRGKGRRKTQAADDTVETRSPELEGLVIADDDFDLHLASLKRAVDAQKRAKNGYDACCKAAKKVSPALLDTIKLAVKMEGKDPEEIKLELEMQGYVLKRSGSHVQLTIHDMLLGDVLDVAYARGKESGGNGKPCASPYPEGSDLDERWKTGWRNAVGGNLGLTEQETEDAVAGESSGLGHNSQAQAAAE